MEIGCVLPKCNVCIVPKENKRRGGGKGPVSEENTAVGEEPGFYSPGNRTPQWRVYEAGLNPGTPTRGKPENPSPHSARFFSRRPLSRGQLPAQLPGSRCLHACMSIMLRHERTRSTRPARDTAPEVNPPVWRNRHPRRHVTASRHSTQTARSSESAWPIGCYFCILASGRFDT